MQLQAVLLQALAVAVLWGEAMFESDVTIRDRACYIGEVLALLGILNDHGCSTRDALKGTEIDENDLLDWRTKISMHQQLQLHANGARVMPLTSLALAAGRRLHLSSFGFAGSAMASAKTLKAAIDVINRFAPLMNAKFRLELREANAEAVLRFHSMHSHEGPQLRFCIEFEMVKMLALLREAISPDFALTAVALSTSASRTSLENREYVCSFGILPQFDAPVCEMRFDARWLSVTPVACCAFMYQSCIASCERIMAKVERDDDVSMRVQGHLMANQENLPTLTEIAESLNVSPRTLRRKLAEQGTSYNVIIDEVRKRRAINLLSTSRLSAEEISSRVGYSDASNFRHAFKRWTGLSPSDFRDTVPR